MTPTYRQVQAVCRMIRERRGDEWDAWVTEVQQRGVKDLRGFVQGLLKDEAAVRAGLSLVWSNGPTEWFIHRLKLIKRQAYRRASVDFLRHRISRRLPGWPRSRRCGVIWQQGQPGGSWGREETGQGSVPGEP